MSTRILEAYMVPADKFNKFLAIARTIVYNFDFKQYVKSVYFSGRSNDEKMQ